MKSSLNGIWMALLAVFLHLRVAEAYPPAPQVLIYGLVKDQYGMPLADPSATVILQTPSGAQVVTSIQPNLAIGVNYAMWVPMDSGITTALYATNALTNGALYQLYVYADGTTNLPIEMAAGPVPIVAPSQRVLQNLSLGTDANADGIPDAWELAFLQSLGLYITLNNINPNASYTPDGRTLYQEYRLGNYPYNSDPFTVKIISEHAGSAMLSFTTTAGRTYSVYGSANLKSWTPLAFTVPAAGAQVSNSYYSSSVQAIIFQTMQPTNSPTQQFFKLSLR